MISTTLTGLLTGSKLPSEKRANPMLDGAEHFIYCLDPARCCDIDQFRQRVAEWTDDDSSRTSRLDFTPVTEIELHPAELTPLIQLARRFKIETSLDPGL